MAIILVIVGDIGPLINFFSFASWLFYGMAGFCVIILRFTRRDAERKFKVFFSKAGILFLFLLHFEIY